MRGPGKGKTNNAAGRPKGSVNRVTLSQREFLKSFLEENRARLQADWDAVEPFQRLTMFDRLLGYTLPKMNNFTIETLDEEHLDSIIEKIKANYDTRTKG